MRHMFTPHVFSMPGQCASATTLLDGLLPLCVTRQLFFRWLLEQAMGLPLSFAVAIRATALTKVLV